MKLNFAEAMFRTKDPIVIALTKLAIEYNPSLMSLPLRNANKVLTHKRRLEDKKPVMESRQYNGSYATNQKATFKPYEAQLKPHGGKFIIDPKYKGLNTPDGKSQLKEQIDAFAESLAFDLPDAIFNDDESALSTEFNGVKAWLRDTYNDPEHRILYDEGAGNPNGIAIADAQKFILHMNQLLQSNPSRLYTTRQILNQMDAVFANGNNDSIANKFKWNTITLANGDTYRQATWDGIPIEYPGENSQEVEIIGQNETLGTSNIVGSIYAIKYGANNVDLLQDAPAETRMFETEEGTVFIVDWALTLDIPRKRSVKALYGILA